MQNTFENYLQSISSKFSHQEASEMGYRADFEILIKKIFESINVGKNEKMEVLYEYLTGTEFRHRVESIAEAFTNLQTDIEKEKRFFTIKWARQEKELRKIIDSTHGMYGELQAVSGRALQTIKQLEPPSEEK